MTLQEQAFINWYDNQPTFGVDYQEIWNAACAWQREQILFHLNPDKPDGFFLTEESYEELFE